MKKALLFAILALSINAFAQNNQTIPYKRDLAFYSDENIKSRTKVGDNSIFKKNSEENLKQLYQPKALKNSSLVQIYDSIYYWKWDRDNTEWKLEDKDLSIIYDGNKNLISFIKQGWWGSTWMNIYKCTYTYDASNNLTCYTEANPNDSTLIGTQYIYTYDANNNLTSELFKNRNSGDLENYSQSIYTYDANNNRTSELFQYWVDGAWKNYSLFSYTFDENHNLTDYLDKRWNGDSWNNYRHETYAYDGNNRLVSYMVIGWDPSFQVWKNSALFSYSYNANNQVAEDLQQQWYDSAWMNTELNTYEYDVNNNLVLKLHQESMYGAPWINHSQNTYAYDAGNNLISDLRAYWDQNAWYNSELHTYTYDANRNQTSNLFQDWRDNAWHFMSKFTTSYDANSFREGESYKYWDFIQSGDTLGDSTHYYFHTVLDVDGPTSPDQSLSIYPNPTTGKFTISATGPISSVEIYNLIGDCIYSDYNYSRATSRIIDLFASPKGIYLVKVKSGEKEGNRKIVIR